MAVVAVLCIAGLRVIIAGPPRAPAPVAIAETEDLATRGFAESFARAYLSWDAERPERHERAVSAFASAELEPAAGLDVGDRSQSVRWTTVADLEERAQRQVVTVLCETDRGRYYLTVSVSRDERGFLYVGDYPSIVGAPPANVEVAHAEEEEVESEDLRAVAERAIGNYLAGSKRNLLADLDPKAIVSLPQPRLRVESVDELTWARPGVIAVQLQARAAGQRSFTLRYELAVIKRDRWYVRSIQVNPTSLRRNA